MEQNKKKKINSFRLLIISTVVLLILNAILTGVFIFRWRKFRSSRSVENNGTIYERHFAMIVGTDNNEFWDSVYEGALEMGIEHGAWVERMGENLNGSYSKTEQMKIAIAEKVDGILLEYSDDEEMAALIDEAAAQGIPVVTLLRDAPASQRISYVGISYYNLGQQYAEQIICLLEKKTNASNIFLLMNSDIADSSRTIVYSTIQETMASHKQYGSKVTLNPVLVNESNSFEAEENIRDIFMNADNLPDIIVCLDEITSACVYQALIDYNKVGTIEEIAYYNGSTILKGIQKQIIHSTTSVDTENIGGNAVEALLEFADTGYVSDYYSVDTFTIDSSNVAEYMEGGADEE